MKRIPPEELEHVSTKEIYDEIHKYFDDKQNIKKTLFNVNTENAEQMKKQYRIDIYDNFVIDDIRQKDYTVQGVFQTEELIHDLMRVIALIDTANSPFLFKIWDENGNTCKISQVPHAIMKKKLKSIDIKVMDKIFNVWDIVDYGKNINFFIYNQVSFYSDNPRIFSLFRGFPYKPLRTFDKNVIGLFLEHFIYVICSKNMEVFHYLCSWIAFLLQKPGVKIGTALVLVGIQGTGKTMFTNAICQLLGVYGIENANLNNITGKHNSQILNKMLIVVNEVDSSFGLKRDSSNILKTLITEKSIDINPKHKETFTALNYANFIFVSNNFIPIRIEPDDRRYCVLQVNGKYKENYTYFGQLFDSFAADGFYENLLTFFLNQDIDNWNPEKTLPFTEAKKTIIDACAGSKYPDIVSFANDNKDELKRGVEKQELYEQYTKWAIQNEKEVRSRHEFNQYLLEWCNKFRPRIDNPQRKTYYKLKEQALPPPPPPPPLPPPEYEEEQSTFPFELIEDQSDVPFGKNNFSDDDDDDLLNY